MFRSPIPALVTLTFLAFFSAPAHAMVVDANQVIEGNIVARERVVDVKGVVRHDAYLIGKTVNISGSIGGDAFVIADTLAVSGTVDGSLRAIARIITIDGVVNKNVAVIAERVLLNKSARVGWDVWARASHITLAATVDGSVILAAHDIALDGVVRKDVQVRVPRQGTVSIRSGANIVGDVLFFSPSEGLQIDPKAQVQGRIIHDPRLGSAVARAIALFVLLLGLAVVGAALLGVAPTWFMKSGTGIISDFVCSLLWGFGVSLLFILFIPLTFFTGVGIGFSFILLLVLMVGLYLGTLISVFALGVATLRSFAHPLSPFATLLVGLFIYGVLAFIPLVGSLARVLAACVGFGAMALEVKRRHT